MYRSGGHPEPSVPVVLPSRVSRRQARAARKKLKRLRSHWKDIPAADRVVLRATADARDTLGSEISFAFIVTMIVAVAAAAIAYGVVELGPAIQAATGAGTRGWFVAQQMGCETPGCHWVGSFESLSRHVILRNVSYADADRAMHAGSVVPALFPGGGDLVYAREGSVGWLEPAVFLLLGTTVIAALLWYGPVRYMRRRLRDRQIHHDLLAGLGPS